MSTKIGISQRMEEPTCFISGMTCGGAMVRLSPPGTSFMPGEGDWIQPEARPWLPCCSTSNASAYHRGKLVDAALLGVRAVDDRTLILELEQPAGYFLRCLRRSLLLPSHVLERCGEGWTRVEDFVTNGPFVLKAWHRGHSLTLLRNPFARQPEYGGNVIEVEDKFLSDWPTMLALYEADELDSVSILNSTAERYANGPFNFARVDSAMLANMSRSPAGRVSTWE